MCLGKYVFVWFAGVAFAARALASGALADDAVGALRVDVGTDGVAEFAMPFVPLPGIGPGAFLHGSFGSGEESPFDMLVRLGTAEDLEESAVWAFGTWLDPETWLPSVMSAAPGDEFLFFRSVGGPFSFTVFGIDPLRTSRRGVPASRSRAVAAPSSPDGKVAASPEGTPRLLPDQSSGAGIQPGLAAACYAFPGELAVFPDVSSLVPDATAVVSRLDFNVTTEAWDWMPTNVVDRFAAVFEGLLLVGDPGLHSFKLFSDDGAILYLDGSPLIDRNGINSMTPTTAEALLSPGYHTLRVEYFDNLGHAGLVLWWTRPGQWEESVASDRLWHAEGPYDSDGDGMPDWWEEAHSLDPADPSDAALDPDGDGLSSLTEFQSGTDPSSPDTDSDGMPDAWEVSGGTCPFLDDALADPDGDGLVNAEEMRFSANPLVADTDGDGVSDGDERHVYFSDPGHVDFSGQVTTNYTLDATCVDETFGDWFAVGPKIVLRGRSGTVFCTNDLVLAEAGLRQVRVACSFTGPCDAEIVCRVDGIRSGVRRIPASEESVAFEAVFLTPWLASGVHEMSFELQNFMNGAEFELDAVAVCEPGGPDADGNGLADWIDARIRNSSASRHGVVASKVSPYCMRGLHSSELLPAASSGDVPVAVRPLPFGGWWANVALDASNDTSVVVSYENGMKTESVSVRWSEFDVLSEPGAVVRLGDSLRLSLGGLPGSISVDGVVVSPDGSAVAHCFDVAGEHAVEAVCGGVSRSLTVAVVGCSLAGGVPVWRGKTNSICMTGSCFGCMSAVWEQGCDLVSTAVSGSNAVCSLSVPFFGRPSAFSLETSNPDASVAASAWLLPFAALYTLDGVYHVSHRVDAGTREAENRVSAFDLPEGVELRMSGMSGICYEDGSGALVLHADDFDETGDCLYRFLLPEGVSNPCQFLHACFGGKEVAQ